MPVRIFYYLAVTLVLLAVFGVKGSDTITKNIVLHKKARLLESSINILRPIAKRVDTMRKEEQIIRNFVGFEDTSKPADHMGQGGSPLTPVMIQPQFDPQVELDSMAPEKPLHIQASELRDDLHALTAYIAKKNQKLNYLPSIMPIKNSDLWITSNFGWRISPFTGMREMHNGLDIAGKRGLPVIAAADGTVESASFERFFGNMVTIRHDARFKTSYAHLLKIAVRDGQKVVRGQTIGYLGSTGRSTGNHLHYIVKMNGKEVNPYDYILNRTEVAFAPARRSSQAD